MTPPPVFDERNFSARQALIEFNCSAPGIVGGGDQIDVADHLGRQRLGEHHQRGLGGAIHHAFGLHAHLFRAASARRTAAASCPSRTCRRTRSPCRKVTARSAGTVRLPVGYSHTEPIDAAAYLAEHPDDATG